MFWPRLFFPECVARVPVSFGGLGVRLCSRKVVSMFATVRNRSPTTATVCVSAVRLSTVASAPGVIPKACQVDSSICVAAVILVSAAEVSV